METRRTNITNSARLIIDDWILTSLPYSSHHTSHQCSLVPSADMMLERRLWIATLIVIICTTIVKAQNVTHCTSSCGDIHNISFPFRLKADPHNCGDSRFELDCQNNRTVISLSTFISSDAGIYNVLEINYDNFIIRAIDPGVEHQISRNCTTSPNNFRMFAPTASAFDSISSNRPILYVNCLATVKSSSYVETTFCGSQNKTTTTSSESHSYLTTGQDMTISDLAENCSVEMVAWTSARGLSVDNNSLSSIHAALTDGFELSWKRAFMCRECEARGAFCSEDDGYSCSNPCYSYWVMERIPLPCRLSHNGVSILSLRSLFGLVFLIALIVYKWRRQHLSMYQSIEDFLQIQSNFVPIKYSYSEIKKMTNKFKEKLGEGAYGTVFKGKLRSGPFVAVKMMHKSMTSGQEFISEVSTIGRIHHVNVVQLIGFCVEGSKRALVYEFMPNGSLDKYIFLQEGIVSLSYKQMFDISLGVARGVEYLHRGCDMQILHFDIKPHNILLDENFSPKISDFGLAKLYPTDDSIVSLTAARGTMGYMAPELFYKNIGGISYKADVYSYGMLLMEMAGRRKNMSPFADHLSQIYFPTWVYDQFDLGNDIEIQDATDEERSMVKKMMIVALWCIQMKPADRPAMNKVVEMLEGDDELLQEPPRPFIAPREINAGDVTETIRISCDILGG
ncbi:rust resistance kinase Lr10-like isoform X2 [Nicotiana tabacum]|uniref:non-specific serine/threonine protein kinase n=1 Tax=Nicotiana tabacum TaxID=4097 RepID=A0A1S3XYX4_TOBAC|nr:PREDICTED: rust resistance kinase Lr10-like isoform X2 [Nicotiana tabacum]